MENIFPRVTAIEFLAVIRGMLPSMRLNMITDLRQEIEAEHEKKLAALKKVEDVHAQANAAGRPLGYEFVPQKIKDAETLERESKEQTAVERDRTALALVISKAPMRDIQRRVLACKTLDEARAWLANCELPISLFSKDEQGYLPQRGQSYFFGENVADGIMGLPLSLGVGLLSDPQVEKRDRSNRKGKELGPISQVLDFTYANKKEAFVFILCGASFDNKAVPAYHHPVQVYDASGTRAKVPRGCFILPKFLIDAGQVKREEANLDKSPTVFTIDTAIKTPPPDIMLGEFCDALELPYVWVIYFLTIQAEKIPACLRLAEMRGANTWRLTSLAWNAFMKRDLAHIRALAGHFKQMVRTEHDPNAWTAAQLERPVGERPKIGKENAVAMARRVNLDNAAIQKAYVDLQIPENLREPLLPQRGGARFGSQLTAAAAI
jgi:hypothetical protein